VSVVAGLLILCANWLTGPGAPGADAKESPQTQKSAEVKKSVQAQIAELLDRATTAETDAEKMLAQAENLLWRGRHSLDKLGSGFLSADITRTRGRVCLIAWQRDADNTAQRDEAKRFLMKAREEYEQLKERADEEAAELLDKVRKGKPERNPAYRRALGLRSRANYAIAWTDYNLGLVADGAERASHIDSAIERFKPFTSGGYRSHPIVADCFLGQALCYYELGRYGDVTSLLEPAEADNTPEMIFKRMTYLRLKSYQQQSRHRQLDEAADKYFASLADKNKLDSIELGMAVEWARSLAALAGDPEANPYYKQYQNRLDRVAKMVYPYGDPWRSELAEVAGKTAGSSLFTCLIVARGHFTAGRYAEALGEIAKCLDAAGGRTPDADESLLADLRYTQAAAAWNLKRWHQAHRYAFEFLRYHAGDRRADDVCSRGLQAGLKAIEQKTQADGPGVDAADFLRFLTFAEKNLPENPEVLKAAWYRGNLLLKAGKYAEAEQALQAIEPSSPVYRYAQYGLALAAFKQAEVIAQAEKKDPAARAKLLARSAGAVRQYVEAAAGGLPADEHEAAQAMIDVALATGQHLLDLPAPDHRATLALLRHVESLVKALGEPDRVADQRLALSIEAYIVAGQLDAAGRQIDAVLDYRAGSAHAARAFANIADTLEERYERLMQDNQDAQARRLGERLLGIYTFLLDYVSRSKDAAVADQEIPVRRRLARALLRQGNHRAAISHYEWLLGKVPLEKAGDVLQGLATAQEELRDYDSAAKTWRTLARGLEDNSEGWFEARYHLILCHHKAGRQEHARKLLAYFRLQCPHIASEVWRRQFDALEQELAGPRPGGSGPSAAHPRGGRAFVPGKRYASRNTCDCAIAGASPQRPGLGGRTV